MLRKRSREGSCEIVFEKVLSWLVGHLDASNVTGHQWKSSCISCSKEPIVNYQCTLIRFVDTVFEQMIAFVSTSILQWTIHRAHRRIAEFAAERVMAIMPDVKAQ